MASGYPDWTRAFLMLGQHAGEYKLVAVDEQGRLYSLMRGEDGTGALKTVRLDADGQMIAILKGASGEYLGIDEDGYLTTVIKGEYANELRTVKLDGEGRLSAFVIDSVDAWGDLLDLGLGELAVRLGSPITFQRSGHTQIFETFENGIGRVTPIGYNAEEAVEVAPVGVASGGYCCKLTTGPTEGNYVGIYMARHRFPLGKWGFGLKFSFDNRLKALEQHLMVWDTSHYYTLQWEYVHSLEKLYLYNQDQEWQEVADIQLVAVDRRRFNQAKLTADLLTGYYSTFYFNHLKIDCSGIQFHTQEGLEHSGVGMRVYLLNRTGYTDTCYVDDVFLTVAEP